MHDYNQDFVCSVWTFAFLSWWHMVVMMKMYKMIAAVITCPCCCGLVADCRKRRRRACTLLNSISISFQLLKYFWVGFPFFFHTYFSFFSCWISERLHLLPHLSLIPSYPHIWWYLGNYFISDGHFSIYFCVAKPKWLNIWVNLLMHTILDILDQFWHGH